MAVTSSFSAISAPTIKPTGFITEGARRGASANRSSSQLSEYIWHRTFFIGTAHRRMENTLHNQHKAHAPPSTRGWNVLRFGAVCAELDGTAIILSFLAAALIAKD
jgi:hypothetical protein